MGFLETPYWRIDAGKVALKEGIRFLSAEEEDYARIAQANVPVDKAGIFQQVKLKGREHGEFPVLGPEELDFMDVAPNQIVGVSASLIPFLENDDANRALMGSNMQRQAVPLIKPQAPIVGTGLEGKVALDSRMLINAEGEGVVEFVDATKISESLTLCQKPCMTKFGNHIWSMKVKLRPRSFMSTGI